MKIAQISIEIGAMGCVVQNENGSAWRIDTVSYDSAKSQCREVSRQPRQGAIAERPLQIILSLSARAHLELGSSPLSSQAHTAVPSVAE